MLTLKDFLVIAGTLLASFAGSYTNYRFNIKGKLADRDLNKEYELNSILSNLLDVWYYLRRVEVVLNDVPSIKQQLSNILPNSLVNYLTYLSIKQLDNSCFNELEQSIKNLKKYDPITYFKHIETGIRAKHFSSLSTFLAYTQQHTLVGASKLTLQESIDDVKISIDAVADLIGPSMTVNVKKALNDVYTDHELLERYQESFKEFKDDVIGMYTQLRQLVPADKLAEVFDNINPTEIDEVVQLLFNKPDEAGAKASQAMDAFNKIMGQMVSNQP